MREECEKNVQANRTGDRADRHAWRPGMTAVRDGWPDTVTVLTLPHPCAGDRLVQVSQGGDVLWCSIDELSPPAAGEAASSARAVSSPRRRLSRGRRLVWGAASVALWAAVAGLTGAAIVFSFG